MQWTRVFGELKWWGSCVSMLVVQTERYFYFLACCHLPFEHLFVRQAQQEYEIKMEQLWNQISSFFSVNWQTYQFRDAAVILLPVWMLTAWKH